jgi:hypothetical protein
MEPKGFLIYPNKGIACALSNNYGHEQYPFDNLLQNNYAYGVYKILSSMYCFLSRFELLFFGGKKRFFCLSAWLE